MAPQKSIVSKKKFSATTSVGEARSIDETTNRSPPQKKTGIAMAFTGTCHFKHQLDDIL
ncbi:MAG: hypothetical protein H7Z16_07375 [Pyrinomonadaceae bacterium]|nr:hypothetical protein [Pyrinomonadaceae bacterium]